MSLTHPLMAMRVAASATTALTIFGANLVGWWRGTDGGSTTSTWVDLSGAGNNATWVGTPGTTPTLNGHPGWDATSGQYAHNTTTSIVTAGAAFTVLAVAQAKTAGGGGIFVDRTSTEYNAAIAFTTGGLTYYFTSSVTNDNTGSSQGTTLQSPFLAQWSFGGTGTVPTWRLNRSNQTSGSTNQAAETGSAGFELLRDSASAQPWNGYAFEIAIVKGSVSGASQTSWENYVSSYYGI